MARVRSRNTLRRRSKTAPQRRRRKTRRTRGRKSTLRRKTSKKKNPKRRSMKRKIMRGGAPDVKVYVDGNWVPARPYQKVAFTGFKESIGTKDPGEYQYEGEDIRFKIKRDSFATGAYMIKEDGSHQPIADDIWFTGSDNLIVDESGNALVKGDHGDTRLVRISGPPLDPAIVANPFKDPTPYPGLTIVNREAGGSEVMREIRNPDVPKTTRQLFVLPSQLNGAEYPAPEYIVHNVEEYKTDQTGGPRGQLACDNNVAQEIINNASNDNNPNGVNYVRDVIKDGGKITLNNGYLMVPDDTTDEDVKYFSDNLHKMECLASADIPVTGYNPEQTATSIVEVGGMGLGKHKIGSQVKKVDLTYTSAIPIGEYGNSMNEKVKKIAQLVIYAQYVCALKFACERAVDYQIYQVNLLPLGGGVFNNPREDIVKAILHAINTVRKLPNFDKLEIRLLLWDGRTADGKQIRPSEVTDPAPPQLPYSEILDKMNSYLAAGLDPEPEPEPEPAHEFPKQGTLINADPQYKTVGYVIEEWGGAEGALPNDTSVTVIRAGPQKDGDNTYIVKTSDEGPGMMIKEKHVKSN